MRTDTATRLVPASPEAVYGAFVDAEALMAWLPPQGMSGRLLLFEPRQGGRYRIELALEGEGHAVSGKTTERTDITSGRFVALEPGRRIVQTVEFESGDPAFAGTMVMTWSFEPAPDGTRVTVAAENVPAGISAEDHAAGLASSLENLARHLEPQASPQQKEKVMPLADARPVAMIVTSDRKLSEPFYGETLGLRRLPGDDFAAVYDLAGVKLRLTEVPGHKASAHPVLGWEVSDIKAAVEALGAKGVAMQVYAGMGQDELGIWTAPDGSAKVAFFADPDGNGLSLTEHR